MTELEDIESSLQSTLGVLGVHVNSLDYYVCPDSPYDDILTVIDRNKGIVETLPKQRMQLKINIDCEIPRNIIIFKDKEHEKV